MAPALAQLFESRMKAGISRRAGSKAKKAAAAASAEDPAAAGEEAAVEPAPPADVASPAQVGRGVLHEAENAQQTSSIIERLPSTGALSFGWL